MAKVICALGRHDNHAIISHYAKALGISYVALDEVDAREIISTPEKLNFIIKQRISSSSQSEIPILTLIDSSVKSSTLRSLVASTSQVFQLPMPLRSDPSLIETIQRSDTARSLKEVQEFPNKVESEIFLFTVVRSPHGQVATYPLMGLRPDGTLETSDIPDAAADLISAAIDEVSSLNLVGALTFLIARDESQKDKGYQFIDRQFGLTPVTLWSEHACYTSVAEQMIRAVLDLPLGDSRMIDYEEFYLEQEINLMEHAALLMRSGISLPAQLALSDPIRPFLHLFARNPRLRIFYLDESYQRIKISLFAVSEEEAKRELAHAKDFMVGKDD